MRTKTATVLLLCTVFIMLLNQTLMTTAMPVIASSLNISVGLGQWLTTGYVLILGVISPMTAQLITKFSSRHLFLSILAIFLVGTIITMLNSNFWFLLLGRLIQACAGGILISFVQVSLLILHRPEKRGTVLGIQALVITCAPALGPTLAGIVIKLENWQALFSFQFPIMFIILIISWFWFPNYTDSHKIHIDWLSVFCSLLGISALLIGINLLKSNLAVSLILIIIGLLFSWWFVRRQTTLAEPTLRLTLFKKCGFRRMTLIIMLCYAAMLGGQAIVPLLLENWLNLSGFTAGLFMLPGALLNAIFSPIAGSLYDKHGIKTVGSIGLFLSLIAEVGLVWTHAPISMMLFLIAYTCFMVGVAFLFTPAISASLAGLTPEELNHGTVLTNTLRQIAASFSMTILVMITSGTPKTTLGFQISIVIILILTILGLCIFVKQVKADKGV